MARSIKDAKKGDYVQYVGYRDLQNTNAFTVGKYYQLRSDYSDSCYPKSPWAHVDSGYLTFELDDKGSTTNGWGAGLFKLIATKSGSQVKVGDTVIPKATPAKSFMVTHVGDTHIQPGDWRKDCVVVICEDKKKELPLPINQEDQDFLTSLDYTEKIQPLIRRNLAFYKRSGLPWTRDEYSKILFYTEGKVNGACLGKNTAENKFIYDCGDTNGFQFAWDKQILDLNFKHCKQVAYEDIFPNKRIAVVTRNVCGHPVGSRIIKAIPCSDTRWKLADGSSNQEYTHKLNSSCVWENELDISTFVIDITGTTRKQRLKLKKVLETNNQTVDEDSAVLTSSNIGSNTALKKSFQEYWLGTNRDANISLEDFILLFSKPTIFTNPCSEIPISIPTPQIKPTQKEITMPTTIQQILSRLFGLEKPTTDYENRAAYIVVAYNRDGSEMGTATAASLKIIKDKVAATPELWGCKVLAYKLEKEVSVTIPVKATGITVHVPVAEEPAEK